ncbi:MAG TPA: hypothetical protein VGU45_13600 [Microvirga sp.]|jgi:hypothetical protein|nr:hypothetical protein [Microvirga sp.]
MNAYARALAAYGPFRIRLARNLSGVRIGCASSRKHVAGAEARCRPGLALKIWQVPAMLGARSEALACAGERQFIKFGSELTIRRGQELPLHHPHRQLERRP